MKMVRNTALWLLLLSTVASAQTNSSVILKLVDASESERNAREIVTFLNDAVVDIVKANTTAFSVAAVAGDEVISVKFDNDETEANRPFARCGDVYGRFLPCEDLVMGTHTVSVTTYPEAEQGGTPLETVSATFEITDSSIPTQSPTPALTLDITEVVFQLEDASTGEANGTPLVNLTDGAIVDLDELRTSTLGIVALCGGDVGSVVFENGQKESNRPFSRCGGEASVNPAPCPDLVPGTHVISVTPFTEKNQQGLQFPTVSLTFEIVGRLKVESTPDSNQTSSAQALWLMGASAASATLALLLLSL